MASGLSMAKVSLPPVFRSSGFWSKVTPKALRNSRGSRWAKEALRVVIRSRWGVKLLQNRSTP